MSTRRNFLKTLSGMALLTVVPRHVLGGPKHVAPSDQLTKGIIGVGGIGKSSYHFTSTKECRLVAVCDVDSKHLQSALDLGKKRFNETLQSYRDFRRLIADPNVDIVHIATPPHWHGIMAVEAAKAGKDIWCEKPMTRTIGDGKRVVILAEAQSLGVEAANALLKSLEEPRPGVCFLLLAPQRERLLPTLVSRGWVVTLAWPEAGTPSTPELFQWEEALAEFMASGQGWLDKTSGKGAVDAALARRIVLSVQKAQAALHAGRDGGPLGRRLAILPEAGHLHVNDLLAQCQESLDYMVSPPLVLNWLATRLHIVYRHARLRGRKPTA